MWLFTRYSFFSVARADLPDGGPDPNTPMIRARKRAHLEKLQARFPQLGNSAIMALSGHDYRFRIIVAKAD